MAISPGLSSSPAPSASTGPRASARGDWPNAARDPEAVWQEIGPHVLHEARSYASWQRDDQRSYQLSSARTVDDLRAEGKYRVLTPEQFLAAAAEKGPEANLSVFPLGGGIPPELAWPGLRLYAEKVLPHLK